MTINQITHIAYIELVHFERIISSCQTLEQLSNTANWINFIFNTRYFNMTKQVRFKRRRIMKQLSSLMGEVQTIITEKNNEILAFNESISNAQKDQARGHRTIVGFREDA